MDNSIQDKSVSDGMQQEKKEKLDENDDASSSHEESESSYTGNEDGDYEDFYMDLENDEKQHTRFVPPCGHTVKQPEKASDEDSAKYGYEDAAPRQRRRNSLAERFRSWKGSRNENGENDIVDNSQYGYQDGAPGRRRSSLANRIRRRFSNQGDGSSKGGRRRNSLADRIMFWTGKSDDEEEDDDYDDDKDNGAGSHPRSKSLDLVTTLSTETPVVNDESRRPRRRRSLAERIMAWAGAMNQEYDDDQNSSRRTSTRRATLDVGQTTDTELEGGETQRRRRSLTDDDQNKEGEGEVYSTIQGRARRRSSLHDMVERAMAFVNLKPDRNSDELSPFGTRRDSLF